MSLRLTEVAHQLWSDIVRPGDRVLDATAGNGHDTLFLARLCGVDGIVFAIDLQNEAISNTRQRLITSGYSEQDVHCECDQLDVTQSVSRLGPVWLIQADHAEIHRLIPSEFQGGLRLIAFNLGYLPGGDKAVTTQAESTIQALESAFRLVQPGGALSVLVYRGHAGGIEEGAAVEDWLKGQKRLTVNCYQSESPTSTTPVLWFARLKD